MKYDPIIVMEGIDGCGKSTCCRSMFDHLENNGYGVSLFRDPGATHLGEKLREIVLDPNIECGAEEQTLLYTAARVSTARDIRECIDAGNIVILDRWHFSTMTYQVIQGIPLDRIAKLSEWFVPINLNPALCFYNRISVEESRARLDFAGDDDRFARKDADFFRRLACAYETLVVDGYMTAIDVEKLTQEEHMQAILDIALPILSE